jgi:type VI secretion system protein ImpK
MSQEQGLLAICFQEPVTAIVRLRAGRQPVTDPEQFRERMRQALQSAARDARDLGSYTSADIRNATFAVVAFLDESILNSRMPVFADWVRKPLQEELFGTHVAGEVFFDNLRELLSRPDSPALADVLELYSLCLLLGFAGRYTGGRRGDLDALVVTLRDRIHRIRPNGADLSPSWRPGPSVASTQRDPWIRKWTITAVLLAVITLLLFVLYRLSLESVVNQTREIALEVRR